MNHYGRRAMQHWQTHLPQRYAQIPDPQTHFTELGLRVEDQIVQLSMQLAGDDPGGETYEAKVGRLRMARLQAEEMVLREEALLAPETDPDEETGQETEQPPAADSDWIPLVEDPTSPYWQKVREQEQQTGSEPTR